MACVCRVSFSLILFFYFFIIIFFREGDSHPVNAREADQSIVHDAGKPTSNLQAQRMYTKPKCYPELPRISWVMKEVL